MTQNYSYYFLLPEITYFSLLVGVIRNICTADSYQYNFSYYRVHLERHTILIGCPYYTSGFP